MASALSRSPLGLNDQPRDGARHAEAGGSEKKRSTHRAAMMGVAMAATAPPTFIKAVSTPVHSACFPM
jgi:hypothetical protein